MLLGWDVAGLMRWLTNRQGGVQLTIDKGTADTPTSSTSSTSCGSEDGECNVKPTVVRPTTTMPTQRYSNRLRPRRRTDRSKLQHVVAYVAREAKRKAARTSVDTGCSGLGAARAHREPTRALAD